MKKGNLKKIIAATVALVILVVIMVINRANLFGITGDVIKIHITSTMVLNIIAAISIVVVISNIVLFIMGFLRNKKGRTGTLATVIASLVKYASVLIAVCWVLSIIGVNVSTIFASVGILALILGFGAESLVADIVTGVFILFENQYNVGDIIEVDGFRGRVKEIGIRTLSIEDTGSNIKIINNSDLKNIVNRSNQRSVAVCDIGVSYDTNLEGIEEKLHMITQDVKAKHGDMFIGRVEYVGVEALQDSCVVLRFIADVKEEDFFVGRRLLNKEIKIAFDKNQINIPYPQIDVHTK